MDSRNGIYERRHASLVRLDVCELDYLGPLLYVIRDTGSPFGIAGIWENWRDPAGDWIRTFAIVTTDANELVAEIHDRMPVVLAPEDYDRWLGRDDPDPRDLMRPFPAGLMRMWPISTRVNKPENDDPSIIEPIELATRAA